MNSNNFEKKKLRIINFYKQKKFDEVIKNGSKLYNKHPNDVQLTYILGLSSINLQNYIGAEKYFGRLVSIKKSPEFYYIYGNIQKKLKKFNEAISSYENAINLNPKFSEAYNNLGNTKKLINKREEALSHYKKAVILNEKNIQALFNLSSILKENNNFNELIKVYEKILLLDKNNIKTIYNLGATYLFLGNISKGRKYFENVIKLDKLHVPSLRNYVSITKIDKTNKIFQELINYDLKQLNDENKILILNALSKGYFDLENDKLAFKNLNSSNSLKKEKSKFSVKNQGEQFKNIKYFFSDLENTNFKFDNKISSKPVFIVGMPRSGTSLLEQILSSHSKIYGAGELNFLQIIIDKLGLKRPNNIKSYFSEIRDYYYEQITRISKSHLIIDKLPVNFRWLGFIIKSFPEAKIIHIERNPMAVCWSNYKTHFVDSGMDFNLSQEDVANYYSLYYDLMKFWNQKFEKNILNIKYEDFVQDFEKKTMEILSFLNLNWEDEIKDYQKINRVVTTASYQQVREKIKKNTSEEWKKYKDYLMVMQESLTSLKIKF